MNTVKFGIEGMHCEGCASTIQALLERNAGVRKASASFKEREARVSYDADAITEDELVALLEKAGYRVASRSRD